MAFPAVLALPTWNVSDAIGRIRAAVLLRNRFSLFVYITDKTVIIPAGEGLL
jgi:hypothetical protein